MNNVDIMGKIIYTRTHTHIYIYTYIFLQNLNQHYDNWVCLKMDDTRKVAYFKTDNFLLDFGVQIEVDPSLQGISIKMGNVTWGFLHLS